MAPRPRTLPKRARLRRARWSQCRRILSHFRRTPNKKQQQERPAGPAPHDPPCYSAPRHNPGGPETKLVAISTAAKNNQNKGFYKLGRVKGKIKKEEQEESKSPTIILLYLVY